MITVTILTKDNGRTLQKTLESTRRFPEVLILDCGSTDQTLEIAQTFPNVVIHSSPFLGFGPQHNLASSLASNNWILSLDADEVLSDPLIEEILSFHLDPKTVYRFERHNYFKGKRIRYCGGWYPDHVVRLYNRHEAKFSNDLVHEKVLYTGLSLIGCKYPIVHTPYLEIADFLAKMQHYTTLFAEKEQKTPPSLFRAVCHSWYAFFKSYILRRGFMGGREGFLISLYNAHTTFYKYAKALEKHGDWQ